MSIKAPWRTGAHPRPLSCSLPPIVPLLPLGSHHQSFQPPGGTKLSEVRGTLRLNKMLQNDRDNNDNEFHVFQSQSQRCLAGLTCPIKLLQVQQEIELLSQILLSITPLAERRRAELSRQQEKNISVIWGKKSFNTHQKCENYQAR